MKYVLIVLLFIPYLSFSAENRIIDPAELEEKTLEDLYLMRNEIFARHGRPFKTNELHCYFMAQDWYKLDIDYNDSLLTETDIKNVETIHRKELVMLKHNYIIEEGKKILNYDNIINLRQFGNFTEAEKDMLSTNGFFIAPAKHEQFFFVYEGNEYKGIAHFVTTDAILQLFHIFFDYTLRNLEEKELFPLLNDLTTEMVEKSIELYDKSKPGLVKDAALRNIAYFSVPYYFLTEQESDIYEPVRSLVLEEALKCEAHKGREECQIFSLAGQASFPAKIDYSQFNIRGHYTRSEVLGKFFKAMMWYGLVPFPVSDNTCLLQSLIITKQLDSPLNAGGKLYEKWDTIYEPTAFYVGVCDDLAPLDYRTILDEVYGGNANIQDLANEKKLLLARKLAIDLAAKTKIKPVLAGISSGTQFRFMGQRYLPDSEILQRLSNWPSRPFPKGLDIFAVLGSQTAKSILLEDLREAEKWPGYQKNLIELSDEFSQFADNTWQQNLYFSWIWCLQSLAVMSSTFEYPFFMQNAAWEKKNLNTSLGSWAELRHDTILYGKQSGAECGDGAIWYPDPIKGYVEPNVEFYRRLLSLVRQAQEGLDSRDLLNRDMYGRFNRFIGLVEFLEEISVKELTGEQITRREYSQLSYIGATLENLTLSVVSDEYIQHWYLVENTADKHIAVIADVHTSEGSVLEVGVGPAYEIYSVVEIDGYLKLTRGGVFSYYEFTHPAADRLTDEKWQEMLKKGEQPPLQFWMEDIISDQEQHEVPRPRYRFSTGC